MHNLLYSLLTTLLQQPDDLLPGQQLDARHCLSVPDGNSDLRGGEAFLGHRDDEISDGPGSVGHPSGSPAFEGRDGRTDTLSLSFGLNPAHKIILIK